MIYFLITLLIILVCVVALFLISLHLGFRAPRIRETTTPESINIPFQEVSIPTVRNKQLYGWLLPVKSKGSDSMPVS